VDAETGFCANFDGRWHARMEGGAKPAEDSIVAVSVQLTLQ